MLQPRRAEAWFWWGMGHVARKEYEDALGPFKMASGLAKPAIGHLMEDMIYDYAAWCNYAIPRPWPSRAIWRASWPGKLWPCRICRLSSAWS